MTATDGGKDGGDGRAVFGRTARRNLPCTEGYGAKDGRDGWVVGRKMGSQTAEMVSQKATTQPFALHGFRARIRPVLRPPATPLKGVWGRRVNPAPQANLRRFANVTHASPPSAIFSRPPPYDGVAGVAIWRKSLLPRMFRCDPMWSQMGSHGVAGSRPRNNRNGATGPASFSCALGAPSHAVDGRVEHGRVNATRARTGAHGGGS